MEIQKLTKWFDTDGLPLIISGPCSAESEEQVLSTAKELSKYKEIKVFRSGIWKPRTRPNYFEGVGEPGLKWLKEVKEQYGFKTTVEVAKPHHVELCLDHDVDILWLGARTVVNPFSVQEITDVLRGVDIPVMVKNPVNPDLKLWLGAIERVNKVGINRIIAVHRGFYSLSKSLFRNPPMWEIPIELKRLVPGLPVISDPSHICGNRNMLYQISQKALDLEMDGLMIESHIDPISALTDSEQQITPYELGKIFDKLVIRRETTTNASHDKLQEMREKIDRLDEEMLQTLARRLEIVKEIGDFKKQKNLTILQIKRWSYVFEDRLEKGVELGIERDFLNKMLEILHDESIRIQTDIMNED
ncbi:MAG: bifunctional 3-deoxy-7-phosphoheptulonate synthase/chorismate mutase type II [Bacteroidales bacterium]|nr:bifunctional 3-deoxy-7-phosphoheptulonate synthase/chorismate mutase type II [Bacteroidales bacterium]MCF8399696.1 bifunctional 3-deoxy-7-phosphoheptulonate synthase/chorismate mutase type II [Bacteroidales bacterium]